MRMSSLRRALAVLPALGLLFVAAPSRATSILEVPDNGSEQMGRGGAWVARASDPLAAFYNPAGLAGQATKLTLQTNIIFQHTCFKRTRSAYEAAVETTKLQTQSLEIEQEKFGVGLSTNFLVIQYQDYLAQARSTEVAALDAYAKARTQYERAAGITLAAHNVSVDQVMRGQAP